MTAPGPAHEQADHYAVLGVAPTASAAQITGAFRALVRALHPDVRPEHPPADERLARVVAAYDTLRDPERRAAYDAERRGATAPAAQPPARRRTPRTGPRPTHRPRPVVVVDVRTRRPPGEPPLRVGPVRVEPFRE